jgi:caffeoyl-CoA O-methyltransferase
MGDYFRDSLSPQLDQYLLGLMPPRDPVLHRMEMYAVERGFPFIGPLVGELLGILARSIGAKRVLELGSGFGFSALHFARAIANDGRVICTDGDKENALLAEKYFREAGLLHKLEYHVGDAVTEAKKLKGPFDLILLDIDKEGYPEGFRTAWPLLRLGGLFVADNLLWHGRVMTDDDEASTRGVREFSKLLYETPGAKTSILPLRDGVSVTLKCESE